MYLRNYSFAWPWMFELGWSFIGNTFQQAPGLICVIPERTVLRDLGICGTFRVRIRQKKNLKRLFVRKTEFPFPKSSMISPLPAVARTSIDIHSLSRLFLHSRFTTILFFSWRGRRGMNPSCYIMIPFGTLALCALDFH